MLLISDFEPSAGCIQAQFGEIPEVMLLPGRPADPLPGVRYYRYRTSTNPIDWDSEVDKEIRCGIDTVAFFIPADQVRGQTCLQLGRLGVRRVLTIHGGEVRVAHPLLLALQRMTGSLCARWRQKPSASSSCLGSLSSLRPRAMEIAPARLRIAHFVNSLNSGGAERQACYTAIGQHRQGHDVRILLRQAPVGCDAHYQFLLEPHGITAHRSGAHWHSGFLGGWRQRGLEKSWLRELPNDLRDTVMDLAGELLASPVDVLHCYVDDCNVPGVIAASLAGTPCVVLSLRNGNPSHFPGLVRPWMREWYRWAWGRSGVAFVANSAAGARDYEAWLGIEPGSIPVIRNAFYPSPVPSVPQAAQFRTTQGIAPAQPVVAGIFRLEPEKRPLHFLECVDRIRRRMPDVCVLMAGIGSMEQQVRRAIDRKGLRSTIRLLGQRPDVPLLLAASDVLLLVSDWEGSPNVVLEAQHCGSIPVVTNAGGSRDTLQPGKTGILVGIDDIEGTAAAVVELLANAGRRRVMAEAGQRFVADQFAPALLDRATQDLYQDTLSTASSQAEAPHGSRIAEAPYA
jgi:glycosyltransferase involved in cell wall biosynthesis